ncbi:hypothetical protein ACIHDR_47935 [Nocardia sp. NPDC052278]|uniref:hypothetical protein n=1 Tax=unclassified Nocardia TaxID=2637762 RepID=UPI0036B1B3B0
MPSMPHDDGSGDANNDETVIHEVDTHQDSPVAFVIGMYGEALGHNSFAATTTGYRQLSVWSRGFGTLRRASVEENSSYGTAVTHDLRAAGVCVIEVNQPDKAHRRRRSKD